jgi:hypothetical protein
VSVTRSHGLAVIRSILFVVMFTCIAVSCRQVDRFNDPYVSNRTGAPLTISFVHGDSTVPLGITVQSGVLAPLSMFRDGCADGLLIALDEAGHEVARYSRPLCAGETWTIDPGASATPS